MHLHPQLRALRDDDAPQRAAQALLLAALHTWRQGAQASALLGELAGYDKHGAISNYPWLNACFVNVDDALRALVSGLVETMVGALAQAPLGHVPMRHFTDGLVSTLLIAASGGTTLSLVALDGEAFARKPGPSAVNFGDNHCHEHILAGRAEGQLVEAETAGPGKVELTSTELELRPGTLLHRDSRRQAVIIRRVEGVLVTLRLQRRACNPEPTREYALADGQMLKQAAGNPRESRFELAAALLGKMGRADAAPMLAAMAQEHGCDSLRWQALRECLGLDTALGFAALTVLARDPGDSLAAPAGAMRAQLLERHPVLAEISPCPA